MLGYEKLPRTRAFLERVPGGLGAYPDVRLKGSFVRAVVKAKTDRFDFDQLPDELAAMLKQPPLVSEWVPEVYLVAITHALRDLFFDSDDECREWAQTALATTFKSPLYRMLFSMLSPARLARAGPKSWSAIRQGTSRELLEFNENGNLGRLNYPTHLYDRFIVSILTGTMAVVYKMSRAPDPEVRVLEWTPESALVEVLFDKSKTRGTVVETSKTRAPKYER